MTEPKKSPSPKKQIQHEIDTLIADSVESLWNFYSDGFVLGLLALRKNIRNMKDEKLVDNIKEIKSELRDLKKRLKKLQAECKHQREKENKEIITVDNVKIKYNHLVS
jgi:hypothetical protein